MICSNACTPNARAGLIGDVTAAKNHKCRAMEVAKWDVSSREGIKLATTFFAAALLLPDEEVSEGPPTEEVEEVAGYVEEVVAALPLLEAILECKVAF